MQRELKVDATVQIAEHGDKCATLYSQKNWHKGKSVNGGGWDVPRATSFSLMVPKGGEGGSTALLP